jgi:hypothetical protein
MNTMNLSVPPKPESLLEVTVCANGSGNSEYKDIAKDRKAGAESVVMLVQGIATRPEVARAE